MWHVAGTKTTPSRSWAYMWWLLAPLAAVGGWVVGWFIVAQGRTEEKLTTFPS